MCSRVRRADPEILLLQSLHRRTVNYFVRGWDGSPVKRERTATMRSRFMGEMVVATKLPV
jgi:hypothetical protein